MKKQKVICIIPARGGSKGLKMKNLQKVNSKPLIYFPIKAALKSGVCDKVCVSTDSIQIAKVSKNMELKFQFCEKKNLQVILQLRNKL